MSLLDDARALAGELTELRHRLHRHPELGLDLPRTQATVLSELDGLGLEITTGVGSTSVTAVLRGRDGPPNPPVVLLRADMDALPVQEETDVPFRSEVDGVMHACGHDLHTAMLVGAARVLARRRDTLAGDVIFMFQPGEEGHDGARRMLAEGLLEAAGPPPLAAYAMHVMSGMAARGGFATRPGPLMAASDALRVTVVGRGGHGAAPHAAADPLPAACAMVLDLQTALSRSLDPLTPAVLTVGTFHAGAQRNVIPDTVEFEATVRTFDPAVRRQIATVCQRVCDGIAAAHGVRAIVRYEQEYPVTVNDPTETRFAQQVIGSLLGPTAVVELPEPITGSEDFARVLAQVPGAMLFLGAMTEDHRPGTAAGNHSPRATFDDAVLPIGAAVYAALAARRLRGRA